MSLDLNCFEKVGLFFSCKKLPKMDIASQTDGFCVVYIKDNKTNQFINLGHTSVIRDSRDPEWPDQLCVDFHFEEMQEIVVKVYDQDDKVNQKFIDKHEYIGEATFHLSNLMCASGQNITLQLTDPKSKKPVGSLGSITIRGEAVANTRDVFLATFSGTKLPNKDGFFGKSDPFIVISRVNEDGSWSVVWKNEPVMNDLNPKFPACRINMMPLCNGDIDRPLRVALWDYESDGNHDYMGGVDTSVRGLLDSKGAPMNIIEEEVKKKKGAKYVNSGTLQCNASSIERHPNFTDFIVGGLEISLIVGIDFTGSNGDPRTPESLHYLSSTSRNEYQQAIDSVCRIVEQYDTDRMFPVYGFGAKVCQANGQFSAVQHCFPVYGGGLEVHGVEGILQAYSDCLNVVALSGPTLFAPIIDASSAIATTAGCTQPKQKYTILLIIADGVINDMDATIKNIIRASSTPMSIIIVGVGAADFSTMNVLDGDGGLLKSGGNQALRDIVQFVPFRKTALQGIAALSDEVLAEIPGQVLEYMKMKNILPNPPKV